MNHGSTALCCGLLFQQSIALNWKRHLAVDGEHLFDEGSPEMQQAQGKRPLVVRAQRLMYAVLPLRAPAWRVRRENFRFL